MFFRLEKSGDRAYVQIVENKRVVGAVRQSVVARFGRADEVEASGAVASLLGLGRQAHRSGLAHISARRRRGRRAVRVG